MTVTAKALVGAKNAETAQTTQYTAPGATRTIIDKFTATNTTAATLTFSVNIVTAAGTAGTTNLIVQTKALGAGETSTFPELVGHILNPGDFISTLASATGCTLRISGREVTN